MVEFHYSNDKLKHSLKRAYLMTFIKFGFLYLMLVYILFIANTLELETYQAVIFFVMAVLLTIGIDQYILRGQLTKVKNQYFGLTETELMKFDQGLVVEQLVLANISSLTQSSKGITANTLDNESLFVPNLVENFETLVARLEASQETKAKQKF